MGEDRVAKLKQAGNSFYLPLENMWSHPQYVEAIVAADRDLLLADTGQYSDRTVFAGF